MLCSTGDPFTDEHGVMHMLLLRRLLTGVALRRARCIGGVRDIVRRIFTGTQAWLGPRHTKSGARNHATSIGHALKMLRNHVGSNVRYAAVVSVK